MALQGQAFSGTVMTVIVVVVMILIGSFIYATILNTYPKSEWVINETVGTFVSPTGYQSNCSTLQYNASCYHTLANGNIVANSYNGSATAFETTLTGNVYNCSSTACGSCQTVTAFQIDEGTGNLTMKTNASGTLCITYATNADRRSVLEESTLISIDASNYSGLELAAIIAIVIAAIAIVGLIMVMGGRG